jgi:DNA-binding PadR family transcriptional regulator
MKTSSSGLTLMKHSSSTEGIFMSTSSKNFDLREIAGDLLNLVKDRAKDAATPSVKPDAVMIQNAVLATIEDEAKNAAEIVRAISLASADTWSPTSGEIQQTLAKLTEAKFVSAKLEGDRKVYAITKTGKTQLKNAPATDAASQPTEPRRKFSAFPDLADLTGINCSQEFLRAASKLAPAMLDLAKTGTKDQQAAAAALLDETRHKLHVILAEK